MVEEDTTTVRVFGDTHWDLKKVKALRDDKTYDETLKGLIEEAGYEKTVRQVFGEPNE